VDLDLRPVERGERIMDRPGVVREGARVDDDRRASTSGGVDVLDQLAFVVGLVGLDGQPVPFGAGGCELDVVVERVAAVHRRLALTEQVEVRPVQQEHRRHSAAPYPPRVDRNRVTRACARAR
jgi:hypothetical protein